MKTKELQDLLKNESSKRSFINSMTIGTSDFFYFRPNNYRRQIRIKKQSDSIGKTTIAKRLNGTVGKHNKLLHIKNYSGNITIQLGKDKLTAIWSQNIIGGEKEVYKVPNNVFSSWLSKKKEEIRLSIDNSLFDFCNRFNYEILSSPIWSRYEDWIKGESFIDSIPAEIIIHDPLFKKVYADGVEAIGGLGDEPTESIRKYIHNRMAEKDFHVLNWCSENIHCVDHVFKFERIIKNMSYNDRLVVTNYLFEKLGGNVG